ncbi:unnamed protein product [Rotaria sp. Silwood2]|nr:unnamed protein product [Rotaria sp. Silwood2]
MNINRLGEGMMEESGDRLLNTFRSPFWLDESHWFVQCDGNPDTGVLSLYILPYAFNEIDVRDSLLEKSTCSEWKNKRSYNRVRQLTYSVSSSTRSQLPNRQLYNLEKLRIRFPVSDHFWAMVLTFDRLTWFEIILSNESQECTNEFEFLLSRASRIPLLAIQKMNWRDDPLQNLPLEAWNALIKQINLSAQDSCDEQQCVRLSRSSLSFIL